VSQKAKRRPPKPNEKDLQSVYRRRKSATELPRFHATSGTYGGRGGAAEDLGRDGQPRVGKTNRVEECQTAGGRGRPEGRGVGKTARIAPAQRGIRSEGRGRTVGSVFGVARCLFPTRIA